MKKPILTLPGLSINLGDGGVGAAPAGRASLEVTISYDIHSGGGVDVK